MLNCRVSTVEFIMNQVVGISMRHQLAKLMGITGPKAVIE